MFARPLGRDFKGVRVAWWRGLGGIPFEPEVRRVIDANRAVFEQLGCIVEEAEPAFDGVDEAFPTLRHLSYHSNYAALARQRPEWVKDTIRWEIAEAERQTSADVARGFARQQRMYTDTRQFFERYEYFILPVTQVLPFDVTIAYPTSIDGNANGDLHRLDALLLVRDVHGVSGDLGAGRVLVRRTAGGSADRRPSSRGLERVADRARIRASHRSRQETGIRFLSRKALTTGDTGDTGVCVS